MKEYIEAWRRGLDFKGVSTKREYWVTLGINFLIWLFIALPSVYLMSMNIFIPVILNGVYLICMYLPGLALTIRRLHDVNKSGNYIWFSLIPYAGIFILLYYLVQPSVIENNKYIQYSEIKNDEPCSKCVSKLDDTSNDELLANNKPSKSRKKNYIIASLVLISVIVCVGLLLASISAANEKSKEFKLKYIANTKEFLLLTKNIRDDNEAFLFQVGSIWYDGIRRNNEDKLYAIAKATKENSSLLEKMEKDYNKMEYIYAQIKKYPDGYNDDSLNELKIRINSLHYHIKVYYDFSSKIQNETDFDSFNWEAYMLSYRFDRDYKSVLDESLKVEFDSY